MGPGLTELPDSSREMGSWKTTWKTVTEAALECRIAWIAGTESAAQRMAGAGGAIGQLH